MYTQRNIIEQNDKNPITADVYKTFRKYLALCIKLNIFQMYTNEYN